MSREANLRRAANVEALRAIRDGRLAVLSVGETKLLCQAWTGRELVQVVYVAKRRPRGKELRCGTVYEKDGLRIDGMHVREEAILAEVVIGIEAGDP